MTFKKFRGKPYGVEFTAAEQQAMRRELNRQAAEKNKQLAADIDAMVLYALMVSKGWKKKRLKNFWKDFIEVHKQLQEFYEIDNPEDHEWFAHRMLRDIGVDIHQWYKEEMNE